MLYARLEKLTIDNKELDALVDYLTDGHKKNAIEMMRLGNIDSQDDDLKIQAQRENLRLY